MEKFQPTKEFWETGYRKKESIFARIGKTQQNAVFRETLKYIDNLVRSNFTNTHDLRILELGGGNSDWLCHFGEIYNCQLLAIDYSEDGCKLLRRKLKRKHLTCKIINKDFHDVNSLDIGNPLNVVVSFGLLEHLTDRDIIYKIAMRYLSSQGLFISLLPNLTGLNLMWCLKANPSYINWHISLRMHDIIKEIKFQGFQEVHGQYIGGLRLFADSENLSLAIIKKLTNLIGEFISRIVNISAEAYSPFYIVSGKKPLSSAKSE